MPLESARFRDDPVLERIHIGDEGSYLRHGSTGPHVAAVQQALIDLGYGIPLGATGGFYDQTSAAVAGFKTDRGIQPADPVVGVQTITALDAAWAVPFADHEEWASAPRRPIPEFNFTRAKREGSVFHFSPWLAGDWKTAIWISLLRITDPKGSPAGPYTPPATWGVSPLDFHSCQVVIPTLELSDIRWTPALTAAEALRQRRETLMAEADAAGPRGTPAWTTKYGELLFSPGDGGTFIEQWTGVLDAVSAASSAVQHPFGLVWRTFEVPRWRPSGMTDEDPRRAWHCNMIPGAQPSLMQPLWFPNTQEAFDAEFHEITRLHFLTNDEAFTTVLGPTLTEAAALVGLETARIDAAIADLPYP